MENFKEDSDAQEIINHFDALLNSPNVPPLPEHLEKYHRIGDLDFLVRLLRDAMYAFSVGTISHPVRARGFSAGCLKALQAKLAHLVWQVKQVEAGDFSHSVEFMEEFSDAFNAMVRQLRASVSQLRFKEEALLNLTRNLQDEVVLRKRAMDALAESEANFRYMAEHDGLTDCLNRRIFFSRASRYIYEARQRNKPCCIGLADIDFFKNVNDAHGHVAGDTVIKEVVSTLRRGLRETDFVGRYGGEEFVVFFPETTLEQATQVCERIRESVADSEIVIESEAKISVTVSLGVSTVLPEWAGERDILFLQRIIHLADLALYDAKTSGRNRVCQADHSSFAPPAE